jgi:hypothetical protein
MKSVAGIFISALHDGQIYVAERPRKGGLKLLWSVKPQAPTAPDVRIDAHRVPLAIRRQAYRTLGKKITPDAGPGRTVTHGLTVRLGRRNRRPRLSRNLPHEAVRGN